MDQVRPIPARWDRMGSGCSHLNPNLAFPASPTLLLEEAAASLHGEGQPGVSQNPEAGM